MYYWNHNAIHMFKYPHTLTFTCTRNLTRGINLRKIAEQMPGASGAEVKGVCTEAGMYALRERRVHVTQEDFEMAVAKVIKLVIL